MNKYICHNKRCKHEFYSSEDKPIIRCPICSYEILNVAKVINEDNLLFIESMFQNIQTYGIRGTFDMIDKCYHQAIVRSRVRKIFFESLAILHKEFK